jgi:hypothetical protein
MNLRDPSNVDDYNIQVDIKELDSSGSGYGSVADQVNTVMNRQGPQREGIS